MELIQHTPKIWTLRNFISKEECCKLISLSEEKGYEEAKINLRSGSQMMKSIRNNSRLLYTDITLAEKYWNILKPYCPEYLEDWRALGLNEQFRFYKYENDERFKRHIDGRFRRNETEESRITFMIYLNDDFKGGKTAFDDITIKPETGSALLFIHELKHEGCPVISGTKYALRSDVMYRL